MAIDLGVWLRRRDPRHFQVAILTILLCLGLTLRDLPIDPHAALALLLGALLTQALGQYGLNLRTGYASALITGLSLVLLLRVGHPALGLLLGAVAVGSKFLLRWRGKAVFNPSHFGLVVAMLCGWGWVSPGQWGSGAALFLVVTTLASLVLWSAGRWDITVTFLLAQAVVLGARALWLGDPAELFWHQFHSGSFLMFAAFMISDPRPTPDRRAGRVLFALLVVAVAAVLRFGFYQPNELLWALALVSPLTPWIDALFPGSRHQWPQPATAKGEST
ncbi:MAG: RnfABCDGE type electron transport complex subunit D [Magnetococcus sp. WYHC-3]